MCILLYDSNKSIHLPEYVEHIWKYKLDIAGDKISLIFLLQKDIYKLAFDRLSKKGLVSSKSNIQILPLDESFEKQLLTTRNFLKRTILELSFISQFCNKNNIERIIFLNIDVFLIALGLRGISTNRKISIDGILFSPYLAYPKIFSPIRLRKYFQTCILLCNRNIKNIYILNDCDIPLLLNKYHLTSVFSYLPDPIDYTPSLIESRQKGDTKRLRFLISGRITHRKNVHNIIRAIQLLPFEASQKLILTVAGEFSDKEYKSYVDNIVAECHNISIDIKNKHLSDEELISIFHNSDIIFVAYSNFFASSGILGHAVSLKKIVIGAKHGIIGKAIKNYKLGFLVDPRSPISIKNAIIKVINDYSSVCDEALFKKYSDEHSPFYFTKALLERI